MNNNHHDLNDFFGEEKYSDQFQTKEQPKNGRVDGHLLEAQIKDAPRQIAKPYQQTVTGKGFEKLIQESVIFHQSDKVSIDRFHDSERNRNICDFLIQCGKKTAWVEAKSTGTSMEFHRPPSDTVKTKFKQQPLLAEKSNRCKRIGNRDKNMIGALIEFKRKGVPYAVWWADIDDILWIESWTDRKSFNIADLERCQVERPLLRSFKVEYYKPPRALKFYLDIKGMMRGE